jgi:hypothetical protein
MILRVSVIEIAGVRICNMIAFTGLKAAGPNITVWSLSFLFPIQEI